MRPLKSELQHPPGHCALDEHGAPHAFVPSWYETQMSLRLQLTPLPQQKVLSWQAVAPLKSVAQHPLSQSNPCMLGSHRGAHSSVPSLCRTQM